MEIKAVSSFLGGRAHEKGGAQNSGKFQYVVENK
jgi:hypothetical protein